MASEVSVYALYVYALFPLTQMLQQKNKSRAQCPIFNIGMARDFLQITRNLFEITTDGNVPFKKNISTNPNVATNHAPNVPSLTLEWRVIFYKSRAIYSKLRLMEMFPLRNN